MPTSAVLPVKSSAPVTAVMSSPQGRPASPPMILASAGLCAWMPPSPVSVATAMALPIPSCSPAVTARMKVLRTGARALPVPSATALS